MSGPENDPRYPPPPAAAPYPQAYPPPGPGAPPPGQGYGPGAFGYQAYARPVEHPQGTTILVLGILGLVVCGICGIVAWVQGNTALAEIDAAPGRYSNRGSVQAGRVMGIVSVCLMGFWLLMAFVYLIVFGAIISSSGS